MEPQPPPCGRWRPTSPFAATEYDASRPAPAATPRMAAMTTPTVTPLALSRGTASLRSPSIPRLACSAPRNAVRP